MLLILGVLHLSGKCPRRERWWRASWGSRSGSRFERSGACHSRPGRTGHCQQPGYMAPSVLANQFHLNRGSAVRKREVSRIKTAREKRSVECRQATGSGLG